MLRGVGETSRFVSLLKKIEKGYCYVEQWLDQTYKNSQTHIMAKKLRDKMKNCFKYSFLGRITEIKEQDNAAILYNSKSVIWLLDVYKNWKYKIMNYLGTSTFSNSIDELKKGLFFLPVKTGSIILVTAILTNIFFSILLNKEIGLLGGVIRGLLLFVGLDGLFCNATWEDIKKTSAVFQLIYQRQSLNIREK